MQAGVHIHGTQVRMAPITRAASLVSQGFGVTNGRSKEIETTESMEQLLLSVRHLQRKDKPGRSRRTSVFFKWRQDMPWLETNDKH